MKMSERYTARITNDYFDFSKEYWEVEIEANDLDVLNRLAEQIRSLKE